MDQLANAVAENLPAVIGLGKAYLAITAVISIIVVVLLVGGAIYCRRVYSRAKKKNSERLEERKERYESNKH